MAGSLSGTRRSHFLTLEIESHKLRATAFSVTISFQLSPLGQTDAGGRVIGCISGNVNGLQQNVRGREADSHLQLLSRRRTPRRALAL